MLATHLVAPVDVCVDLHHGHRAATVVRLQHRDRNRIVAAEHHRDRAGREHRLAGVSDRRAIGLEGGVVPRHVADVDRARSFDQHRPVEVEVVMVTDPRIRGRRGADCRRRILAVRPHRRVRRCARRADHDDVGTLQILRRDGR